MIRTKSASARVINMTVIMHVHFFVQSKYISTRILMNEALGHYPTLMTMAIAEG